ncbi:MAG: dihydrofolate reductase family protein [Leptospiraceae bacterium]|nr:dihydrofolate reductase family protein [Leptospiraceae bacterium]
MQNEIHYSSFIATSLDGKIATENGGIEWLHDKKFIIPNEDFGYKEFFSTIDCLVMGRNTYEKILEFPEYPYEDKKIWVLSKSSLVIPEQIKNFVTIFNGSILELNRKISEIENIKKVYVDGGQIINSFLKEGLLREITITILPILIGDGIPLWKLSEIQAPYLLKAESSNLFTNGFIQTKYRVE